MASEDKKLNEALADAVLDRPREFFIGRCRFCLWSPSLGMSLIIGRHIDALGVDWGMIKLNQSVEALRLVRSQRSNVCYLLAILTFRRRSDLVDSRKIKRRSDFLDGNLSDDEIASLLLLALSQTGADTLLAESGILADQEEQSKIARHKNRDGHTLTFGGHTVFGSLIGIACKTFGWTKEYVVWGIDLVSLRLLLADSVNSVYLSDDDIKALHIARKSDEVYGMTPEDIAKLKAMDWS